MTLVSTGAFRLRGVEAAQSSFVSLTPKVTKSSFEHVKSRRFSGFIAFVILWIRGVRLAFCVVNLKEEGTQECVKLDLILI